MTRKQRLRALATGKTAPYVYAALAYFAWSFGGSRHIALWVATVIFAAFATVLVFNRVARIVEWAERKMESETKDKS